MNNLIGSSIIAILQNLIASFLAVVFGIAFTQLSAVIGTNTCTGDGTSLSRRRKR